MMQERCMGQSPAIFVLALRISFSYMLVCYLLVNIIFGSLKLIIMPELPYLISLGQFEFQLKHLYSVALYLLDHSIILIAISQKLLHCIVYCAFIAWVEGELFRPCALDFYLDQCICQQGGENSQRPWYFASRGEKFFKDLGLCTVQSDTKGK